MAAIHGLYHYVWAGGQSEEEGSSQEKQLESSAVENN